MTPVDVTRLFLMTVKIMTLILFGLHAVFAVVLVRQEQLMASVLEESFEPVLRVLTILYAASVFGLLLLAFFIL